MASRTADWDQEAGPPPWSGVSLTGLFRGSLAIRPDLPALVEAPCPAHPEGRSVSFVSAAMAIEGLKLRLMGLGIPDGAVVGLQGANSVETVLALLALLEAELRPLLLPHSLSQMAVSEALARAGARGLVMADAGPGPDQAGTFVKAIRALPGIRFVAAFGDRSPPGSVPLCGLAELEALGAVSGTTAPEPAAPEILTVETIGTSPLVVAHRQEALVATALHLVVTAGTAPDSPVLTTLPPTTQAGLVTGLVPALIGGAALHLVPVFNGAAFLAAMAAAGRCQLVVPSFLEPALAGERLTGSRSLSSTLFLHRPPARLEPLAVPAGAESPVVDVLGLGERATVGAARAPDGEPRLRIGSVRVPESADGWLVAEIGGDQGRATAAGPGTGRCDDGLALALESDADGRITRVDAPAGPAARSA
jgi:hypothetical protein